uniref:Uncharacterized protein n=1 Tax=Leersia perrieri TaxID=77586 RepID=A0A0D9W6S7_9ORYZ
MPASIRPALCRLQGRLRHSQRSKCKEISMNIHFPFWKETNEAVSCNCKGYWEQDTLSKSMNNPQTGVCLQTP